MERISEWPPIRIIWEANGLNLKCWGTGFSNLMEDRVEEVRGSVEREGSTSIGKAEADDKGSCIRKIGELACAIESVRYLNWTIQ